MMHRAATTFVLLLLALAGWAQNTPPTISFALDKASGRPGEVVRGVVTVTFAEGLHAYQNPPSEDYMIPLEVKADEGTTLVKVEYPAGVGKAVGGSDVPVLVYSGETRVPVQIKLGAKPGPQTVALKVRYQQCDATSCFAPKTERVEAKVTVSGGTAAAAGGLIQELKADRTEVAPGTRVTLTFRFKEGARARIQVLSKVAGESTVFSLQSGTTQIKVEHDSVVRLTVTGKDGKSETREIRIKVKRPQAEETPASGVTTPPDTPVSSEVPSQPVGSADAPAPAAGQEAAAPTETGLAGWLQTNFRAGNWLFIVLGSVLVGLALTLTPCVYPMIPITVSYFSNQTAQNRAGKLGLGAMYMLGIAITYGIVGAIFASLGKGVGALFTYPWFLFALSALMVVLALSMFDVYEIGVPQFIGRQLKGRSGPVGALVMGLLMGFAAAPCAGALVSAVAIEVANTQSLPIGMLVFSAIGLGLGLPFLALAAVSTGANKVLPKSGGWLKTVKAVLGLVVMWLAVDYLFKGLGLRAGEATTLAAWAGAYGLGAAYLLLVDRSEPSHFVVGVKGTAVAALGLLAGMALQERSNVLFQQELARSGAGVTAQVQWVKYTDAAFEEAKASGKPIMIDATADWCTLCKEIDRKVFQTPRGLTALRDVVALKIDHSTGVDQAYIDATTKRFGIVGLPHIMFFRPGGDLVATKNELADVAELEAVLRQSGASL